MTDWITKKTDTQGNWITKKDSKKNEWITRTKDKKTKEYKFKKGPGVYIDTLDAKVILFTGSSFKELYSPASVLSTHHNPIHSITTVLDGKLTLTR